MVADVKKIFFYTLIILLFTKVTLAFEQRIISCPPQIKDQDKELLFKTFAHEKGNAKIAPVLSRSSNPTAGVNYYTKNEKQMGDSVTWAIVYKNDLIAQRFSYFIDKNLLWMLTVKISQKDLDNIKKIKNNDKELDKIKFRLISEQTQTGKFTLTKFKNCKIENYN